MSLLEAIKDVCSNFEPAKFTCYTFRFIFYSKSELEKGNKNPSFSLISGLWNVLEDVYARLVGDEDISSAVAEYVCEYDSSLCGQIFLAKAKSNTDGGVE